MAVYKSASTLPFGSIVLTIATITYIAENWDTRRPVAEFERQDELSQPNGFVQVDQARRATATLQLATATTAVPAPGDEFTVDTIVYVVGEVSAPKSQGDMWKVQIQAREKI